MVEVSHFFVRMHEYLVSEAKEKLAIMFGTIVIIHAGGIAQKVLEFFNCLIVSGSARRPAARIYQHYWA